MTFIPNDHGNYESYTVRVNVRVTSGVEMARVGAGTFTMGFDLSKSNLDEDDEYYWLYYWLDEHKYASPEHEVTFTKAFGISKYEITQEEYIAVMGKSTSTHPIPSLPVNNLTWFDAAIFCNRLSEADGLTPAYSFNGTTDTKKWGSVPDFGTTQFPDWDVVCDWTANGYRLPTEAQWEYAAKGGYLEWIDQDYILEELSVLDELFEYTGFIKEHEWCWDWTNPSDNAYPSEPQIDPLGPSRDDLGGYHWSDVKIKRTGIYREYGFFTTRAWGFYTPIGNSVFDVGLRVVRNVD